jgi:predicted site-specific integrase-resolvase
VKESWSRIDLRPINATTPKTNQRYYTQEQITQFIGLPKKSGQRIIAYCRVSRAAQKPDLKNQRETLEQFSAARGFAGVEFITD